MAFETVGFIGLGNMGMIVAKKLAEAKVPLVVYDVRKQAVDEIVAKGAVSVASAKEVAAKSDIIISLVRDIPQNDQVFFGPNGVWEGVREGSVVVISASISPAYCRMVYERAKPKGVRVVDAPVSAEARSFVPGKEFAILTLMVGGDEEDVRRCMPIFQAAAKNIIYMGPIGSGCATKLVNNLAMYANQVVAREVLNLGMKAGLDIKAMVQAISASTGYSRSIGGAARRLEGDGPGAMPRPAGPPPANAPESLDSKDRRLALELGDEVGAKTPLVHFMVDLDKQADATYDAYSGIMRRPRPPRA